MKKLPLFVLWLMALSTLPVVAETITIYNFNAGRSVEVDPTTLTAEGARALLPPTGQVVELYGFYIEAGQTPVLALLNTYKDILLAYEDHYRERSVVDPASP